MNLLGLFLCIGVKVFEKHTFMPFYTPVLCRNHQGNVQNAAISDASLKHATYSRKPRRTTGGQTCTWPGCGRLFRHRNIYEEHQRLHEMGIPGKLKTVYFLSQAG